MEKTDYILKTIKAIELSDKEKMKIAYKILIEYALKNDSEIINDISYDICKYT